MRPSRSTASGVQICAITDFRDSAGEVLDKGKRGEEGGDAFLCSVRGLVGIGGGGGEGNARFVIVGVVAGRGLELLETRGADFSKIWLVGGLVCAEEG